MKPEEILSIVCSNGGTGESIGWNPSDEERCTQKGVDETNINWYSCL